LENEENVEENTKLEEKDSDIGNNMTYYKTYQTALKHSRIGDTILYDSILRQYYIVRAWAPIPKDIDISYPPSSPTFSTKDLDKTYKEIFGKKKKKKSRK